jgi:hypothetical protein
MHPPHYDMFADIMMSSLRVDMTVPYEILDLSGSFYASRVFSGCLGVQTQRGDDKMKLLTDESDSEVMLAFVVLAMYLVALGLVFLL